MDGSWNDGSRFPNVDLPRVSEQGTQQNNSTEEVLLKLLHALQSNSGPSEQTSQVTPSSLGIDRGTSGSLDLQSLIPKATSLASQYSEVFPQSGSVPQSPTALAKAQQSAALDDGHEWRKYGQKQAKGATYPRAYYRCAVHGCPAKKTVEKMADGAYDILYKEEHDHSGKRGQGRGRSKPYEEMDFEVKDNGGEEFAGFSPVGSFGGSDFELQENLQAALIQEALLHAKAASVQQAAAAILAQAEARQQSVANSPPLSRRGSAGDLFDMVNSARNSPGRGPMMNDLPPQPEIELPTARSMGVPESLRVTPKFGEFMPLPPLKMESRQTGFGGILPSGPLGPPPGQISRQSSTPPHSGGFDFFGNNGMEGPSPPTESKPQAEDWDLGAVVGQSLRRTSSGIPAIPVGPPVLPPWQGKSAWEGVAGGLRSEPASPLSGSWSPAASSFSNFSAQLDDMEVSSGFESPIPQSPKRKELMGDDLEAALGAFMGGDITLKKRRMVSVHKRTVKVPLEEEALEDGYKWRKYGKKAIKDTPFERSYFRCTKEGCEARKRVERSQTEPDVLLVTYEGQHTHNPSLFKARVRQNRAEEEAGGGAISSMVGAIASLAVKSEPSSPSRAGIPWNQTSFGNPANPFNNVRFQESRSTEAQGRISDVQFEKDLKELGSFNLHDLGLDD